MTREGEPGHLSSLDLAGFANRDDYKISLLPAEAEQDRHHRQKKELARMYFFMVALLLVFAVGVTLAVWAADESSRRAGWHMVSGSVGVVLGAFAGRQVF